MLLSICLVAVSLLCGILLWGVVSLSLSLFAHALTSWCWSRLLTHGVDSSLKRIAFSSLFILLRLPFLFGICLSLFEESPLNYAVAAALILGLGVLRVVGYHNWDKEVDLFDRWSWENAISLTSLNAEGKIRTQKVLKGISGYSISNGHFEEILRVDLLSYLTLASVLVLANRGSAPLSFVPAQIALAFLVWVSSVHNTCVGACSLGWRSPWSVLAVWQHLKWIHLLLGITIYLVGGVIALLAIAHLVHLLALFRCRSSFGSLNQENVLNLIQHFDFIASAILVFILVR